VWSTRKGRVRAVGVTTSRFARNRRALRAAMRRVVTARADNRPGQFLPSEATAKQSMLGRPLAATGQRRVDTKQAFLCNFNA
jgi:hypothetical protein